jgi:hypothetical protein
LGIVAVALAAVLGTAVFLGAVAAVAATAPAAYLSVGKAYDCSYSAGNDDIYYYELHCQYVLTPNSSHQAAYLENGH